MTVEQIKSAIEKLSGEERRALAQWLVEQSYDTWDRQIAEDYKAGRLDAMLDEVRRDVRQGRVEDGP